MDLFEKLRRETVRAQDENDLPDFLALQIFAIADTPEPYPFHENDITRLIEQVRDYDTYGQTGYLGMGVNNVILQGTLDRLRDPNRPNRK
jgi:hypothetical protein